jgi:hypothetical protein
VQGGGHRKVDHLDPRTVFEAEAFEPFAILLECRVIVVLRIGLATQDRGPRADETRQVVHVPVRVVSRDPPPQPQHVGRAEMVAEGLLQLHARHPGVPRLDLLIQQAFLRRQETALAVDVDASPFENDLLSAGLRGEVWDFQGTGGAFRDLPVELPVVVLRPAVEAESDDGLPGRRAVARDEHRSEIARPAAVGREPVVSHAARVDAGSREDGARARFVRFGFDENADHLAGGDPADDLAVDPGDGGNLSGPVAPVVGPPDPRRVVELPFGGHPKSRRSRRRRAPRRPARRHSSSMKRSAIPA